MVSHHKSVGKSIGAPSPEGEERIHKVLARAGLGSRRQIERWITEGLVRVNGNRASLGDRVSPQDRVQLRGRPVAHARLTAPARRVILYHKPEGELVARRDPEGRPTIFPNLPRLHGGRWVAIGRLDLNTSGLLLLTTDGELANRLMHPSHEVEREYAVRVLGAVKHELLQRLLAGVTLDDGEARFNSIQEGGGQGANHWYHVVLREGRRREVRRLWESQGVRVSRLIRVRFGDVKLPRGLRTGQWRELPLPAVNALAREVDLPPLQDQPTDRKRRQSHRKGQRGVT